MVKTPDKSARKTLGLPHVLLQMTDSKGISFYLQRVDLVNVAPLNLFFANRCWLLLIPGRWYVTCLKRDVRFSRNMCNYQRRRVLVKDLTNCKKVSILLGRLGGHGTWLSFWHSLRSFLQWLENRLCQTRWMFKLVELVHAPSGEQKNYNIRQAWYSRPRAPLVAGCSIQSTVNLERYHHLKPEKKWRENDKKTQNHQWNIQHTKLSGLDPIHPRFLYISIPELLLPAIQSSRNWRIQSRNYGGCFGVNDQELIVENTQGVNHVLLKKILSKNSFTELLTLCRYPKTVPPRWELYTRNVWNFCSLLMDTKRLHFFHYCSCSMFRNVGISNMRGAVVIHVFSSVPLTLPFFFSGL